MPKWVLPLALLTFAGWWLQHEAFSEHAPPPVVAPAPAPSMPPPVAVAHRPALPTVAKTALPSAAPDKLDLKSDELRNRLEEQIPRRLYAESARCYHGGLDKDQRLDLTYHLHVAGGAVSIGDVRTVEDTLADTALERCILERIQSVKWRDDALPDLDEDDDLYMRVGGFQSYVASATP
jgi:hypothetical protein